MRGLKSCNKRYDISQSLLFKIGSKKKLAECLGLPDKKEILRLLTLEIPYAKFYIQKKGKRRFCEEPCPQLKKVHLRILSLLQNISIPDYLHSAVKKRSYISNAKVHLGAGQVATLDIKKFYPSISREMVVRFFHKSMECSRDVAATLADLTTCDGHVPTGSPLSPLLAFFACKEMFDKINSHAKNEGVKFTCYVDDLTFSGHKINKTWLYEQVKKIIRQYGMTYHKEKFYKEGIPREVTGVILVGDTMKVCNRHLENVFELTTRLANATNPVKIKKLHLKVMGCISAAGQIDEKMHLQGRKINDFVRAKVALNRARRMKSEDATILLRSVSVSAPLPSGLTHPKT